MSEVEIVPPAMMINGVKPQVAQKVYEMLKQGKRHFGSAGASLTHHVNNPSFNTEFGKAVVRAGMEGERDTSKKLRQWMKNHPNAILFDSVHIKGLKLETEDGDGPDTDHVLIVGDNVFLIDTKRWKQKRNYSINSKGEVLRGKQKFAGGKISTIAAKKLWRNYLHPSAKIYSIVCINSEKVFVTYDENWRKQPFRLVTIDKLISTIEYYLNKAKSTEHINSTLAAQLAVTCIKPFDLYVQIFGSLDRLDGLR